ncbi:dienelactone hydrolase [Galbibacter marinus]|uniref:Dienelactone hydrolase n=1 Tax=Galbibacter marinus TaxID=555500 RepID=K2QI11_9FLAO|nr:dienelactone hydrolase family protein [Galbibacter marinus]EKF54332.1 dienelactone hydrolase [Galbibacter marinus]
MMDASDLIPVHYKDRAIEFQSLITPNYKNNLPGVLILPAWMGIDREAIQAADSLQAHGYIAMVADVYGQGQQPSSIEDASEFSKDLKENFKLYQRRICLALEEFKDLRGYSCSTGIIGYCFGGTGALEAVRGQLEIQAAVCVHGDLFKSPTRVSAVSKAKVLIEHAADDQFISSSDVESLMQEMKESQADWQLITYGDVMHSFTNPWSADYHKTMADRAWRHTLQFLDEVLK